MADFQLLQQTLRSFPKNDLKAICREFKVRGFSKKSKGELIVLIIDGIKKDIVSQEIIPYIQQYRIEPEPNPEPEPAPKPPKPEPKQEPKPELSSAGNNKSKIVFKQKNKTVISSKQQRGINVGRVVRRGKRNRIKPRRITALKKIRKKATLPGSQSEQSEQSDESDDEQQSSTERQIDFGRRNKELKRFPSNSQATSNVKEKSSATKDDDIDYQSLEKQIDRRNADKRQMQRRANSSSIVNNNTRQKRKMGSAGSRNKRRKARRERSSKKVKMTYYEIEQQRVERAKENKLRKNLKIDDLFEDAESIQQKLIKKYGVSESNVAKVGRAAKSYAKRRQLTQEPRNQDLPAKVRTIEQINKIKKRQPRLNAQDVQERKLQIQKMKSKLHHLNDNNISQKNKKNEKKQAKIIPSRQQRRKKNKNKTQTNIKLDSKYQQEWVQHPVLRVPVRVGSRQYEKLINEGVL